MITTNTYLPEGALIHTPENREYISSLQGLETAMLRGKILEATAILCDETSRLHIDLCGIRGFIEREECVYTRIGEEIKDTLIDKVSEYGISIEKTKYGRDIGIIRPEM